MTPEPEPSHLYQIMQCVSYFTVMGFAMLLGLTMLFRYFILKKGR